jgi:hypothetical protein
MTSPKSPLLPRAPTSTILCMLLTQTHRSASTIVLYWLEPWVTKAGCGESGASVGLAPLHLRACGVKGHSPLPWRCERLLLFETVMGTSDLIVNHDRWLLHRPPPSANEPLTARNIHLDMNPWEYLDDNASPTIQKRLSALRYSCNDRAFIAENNDVHQSMGPCVQAIVNLRDIDSRECGGTILIPGSHKHLASWLANTKKTKDGPMQYFLSHSDSRMALAQHPTLRAGSMIVWDQRVFH